MRKLWSDKAWDDYLYWQSQDKKTLRRINKLIKSIESGFNLDADQQKSIGKPEKLKYSMVGLMSVRIDSENRLVYKEEDGDLLIVSCREHYK